MIILRTPFNTGSNLLLRRQQPMAAGGQLAFASDYLPTQQNDIDRSLPIKGTWHV